MKAFRAIAGLTMIVALLGLIAHQHDGDNCQDDCPAVAWHSGAVHCAAPQVVAPSLPEQVVEIVAPIVSPLTAGTLQLFRPRGPPSTVL